MYAGLTFNNINEVVWFRINFDVDDRTDIKLHDISLGDVFIILCLHLLCLIPRCDDYYQPQIPCHLL